jgi:phosphoadenosine phosphosulfate reductase
LLIENTIFGERNKVKNAIERLKMFEPSEGYYLAFSGGKDSQTIYHLAWEAGVKFDAHYNLTTVDPPEVVHFIKNNYPDVSIDKPELTMWQLIVKKLMPPTRLARYCCEYLKEHGGEGRICVTGVRWAESTKRKNNRAAIELITSDNKKKILLNDNDEGRRMFENCQLKGKQIINPIIDWTEQDVWDFLNYRNIKHCSLYDEGFKRIGCIGCPMAGKDGMIKEFKRWPQYYKGYLRAFEKMVKAREERGINKEPTNWHTAQEVMHWWIYGQEKIPEGQFSIFD